MKIRMHSMLRSLALVLAAAALTAGLSTAPTARADDLNFTGTTLSGAGFNGASLQGKPAVLWFWTPWCPFCNQEAPNVSAVAAASIVGQSESDPMTMPTRGCSAMRSSLVSRRLFCG